MHVGILKSAANTSPSMFFTRISSCLSLIVESFDPFEPCPFCVGKELLTKEDDDLDGVLAGKSKEILLLTTLRSTLLPLQDSNDDNFCDSDDCSRFDDEVAGKASHSDTFT